MKKIKTMLTTHGHYACLWLKDYEAYADWREANGTPDNILYADQADKIPRELACKLGTIHPGYMEYYEEAMAVLWQLNGDLGGSENPVTALTWRFKDTHKWVVIWQCYTEEVTKCPKIKK